MTDTPLVGREVHGREARASDSRPLAGRTARIALAYLELTKPRIALLVIVTGFPALLMAANGWPEPRVLWGALAGILIAAGSAASFNHYVDRDIDGLMLRTARRPIPARVLPAWHALALGWALAALSASVLTVTTNLLASGLALASVFYYAVVYSIWLKRSTPQNIVIGGAAGASAPLIAWAAVTGTVGLPAIVMAAIVFLWTPPHFWALSLYRREDYARAGIPMLPVTHGEHETRRQILIYSVILPIATLALLPLGAAGPLYGVPVAVLGALFLFYALALFRAPSVPRAVHLFRFSILYLFLVYMLLTVDVAARLLGGSARG